MTFRVYIARPLPGDAVKLLREADDLDLDVKVNPADNALSADQLQEAIPGASGVLTHPQDRVDGAFFDAAGPNLRVVSNYAVGVDNIDLTEAARRNIAIGHTPGAVTEPTADIAWLLLLTAARRAAEGFELVRSGTWKGVSPSELLGQRIIDKTLLIVGAGRIGYATARRSIGWNMTVLYCARSHHPEFENEPINAKRVSLEDGLAEADFVSLHTPLTEQTRHFIDGDSLARMKPGAVLINTARGAIVDEAALTKALKQRRIFAAGLDVFENEPQLHPGLAGLENVFLMPHLGSATVDDREWMTKIAVENILAGLRGQPLPHAQWP